MERIPPEVKSYLEDVRMHLRLDPGSEKVIIKELHSHFQERIEEAQSQGVSRTRAVKEAVDSFGRPRAMARRMYEAHSKGTWGEAATAALPHMCFAVLFALHLWHNYLLSPLALGSIVVVTLYGWWHGKPSWLYSWIGYSLLPLLVGAYASAVFLWGHGAFPSVWAVLAILGFLAFSFWAILLTTIRVVRRDWILASLMLVPLSVIGGWLLNLQRAGGLFGGSAEALHGSDMPMVWSFIALAVTSAAFVRLRQRVMKVGALFTISFIALAVAARHVWGPWGFFGLLATGLLLLAFVLVPALIEAKVGHGEEEWETWWEGSLASLPPGKV